MSVRPSLPFSCRSPLLPSLEVGKTALTVRYTKGQFLNETTATIGAHFFTKTITFEDMKKDVNLKIWDTAGMYCTREKGLGPY